MTTKKARQKLTGETCHCCEIVTPTVNFVVLHPRLVHLPLLLLLCLFLCQLLGCEGVWSFGEKGGVEKGINMLTERKGL